jgi:hypothetical protein
MEERI